MASVYIIYSNKLNRFYTGSCLDFEERLRLHNSGYYAKSYTSKTDD
ncbi:GIY-YIG nuclease family protein [Nonlabens spongiae]